MYKSEDFWDIVDSVNWTKLSQGAQGYKEGKKILRARLETESEMETFRRKFYEQVGLLEAVVDKYCDDNHTSCGLGDDGFYDLVNHVVGLGEVAFKAELANPAKVVERAEKRDFVESFVYCIPYTEDYDPDEVRLGRARKASAYWATKGLAIHGKEVAEVSGREYRDTVADLETKLGLEPTTLADWVDLESYRSAQDRLTAAQLALEKAQRNVEDWDRIVDSILGE